MEDATRTLIESMDVTCETEKRRYKTRTGAFVAMRRMKWRSDKKPIRVYWCRLCQGYHLTSQLNIEVQDD